MTEITKLIADGHIDDLRRDAERAALGSAVRARRRRGAVTPFPVTIRPATESDGPALARLAALDTAPVPAGPVLLAESDGQLRAALSLDGGAIVADPFHRTAAIVELLVTSAAPGPGRRSTARRFRLGKLALRRRYRHSSAALT
jgi:hypothetical protein